MSNRHDFNTKTKDMLGKRVNFMCSNPECNKPTIGPHSENHKATIVGVAAHITAASPGGPRFEVNYSEDQRRDFKNGIWLCTNCATIIDKDEVSYPKELLEKWKLSTESKCLKALQGKPILYDYSPIPYLETDLIWVGGRRSSDGHANENFKDNEPRIVLAGNDYVMYYKLDWKYRFVIMNNSSVAAYNVSIERIEGDSSIKLGKLDKINNIPPYESKEVKMELADYYKGYHFDADKLVNMDIPPILRDVKFKIEYKDERRNEYSIIVDFSSREMSQTFIRNIIQ